MMTMHTNRVNTERVTFDWSKNLGQDWAIALNSMIESDYTDDLIHFIDQIYKSDKEVYPAKNRLFDPFIKCSLKDVKVVIIDDKPVKSLESSGIGRGIYTSKTIYNGYPFDLRNYIDCISETIYGNQQNKLDFDSSLLNQADQGVLFLNTSMCITNADTYIVVWRNFIREVIKAINSRKKNVVYLFMSNHNNDLEKYISETDNHIGVNNCSYIKPNCEIFLDADNYISNHYPIPDHIEW